MPDPILPNAATRLRRARAVFAGAVLVAGAAHAQQPPAPVAALAQHGIEILGTFPAPGGLTAWAAHAGDRPVALYATPDGKHVIVGTMFDAEGRDVTQAALEQAIEPALSDKLWSALEQSAWVADGDAKAARIVYVFTDPNCPYCNKLWADARPWVETGKVQLRHIPVGILTASSEGKAAAILAASDPAKALHDHEAGHVASNTRALAAGERKPLDERGIQPLADIPAEIAARLNANETLMAQWGLRATPAIVWREEGGRVRKRTGAPPALLPQLFGAL